MLYLYFGYDTNVWTTNDIDAFQVIMISVYLALCSVLSILFVWNCSEQYLLAHLLPGNSYTKTISGGYRDVEQLTKEITNHYYNIVIIPIRQAVVIDVFGKDIGPVILSFLPLVDRFEASSKDMVKVTNVI